MNIFDTLFVTEITHIFTPSFDGPKKFPMKKRENYGICFAKMGEAIYRHNNKNFVCNKNQALIIPQGASYYFECNTKGVFPIINFSTSDSFSLKEFVEIPLKDPDWYLNNFSSLEKAFSLKNVLGYTQILSMLYKIINELNREGAIQSHTPMHNIIEYINDNFCDHGINNESLAKQAKLSVSRFRSLFKASYGTSPMSYVQSLRIEKAKQLLLNPLINITEIAEICGFASLYSFSRAFKANIGMSPSEFAKQNLIKVI